MNNLLDFLLARQPTIYANILRYKKNHNLEKILFLNLLQDGDIVFDIGANIGYYTLLFSHLVGKNGQVHAFEPLPPTFIKLSQKIDKEKKYNNLYLNNAAVSNLDGIVNMYMPDNDHRQASLTTHNCGSWQNAKNINSYECRVLKLDDYIKDRQIPGLNFIKIDVEGAELLALQGAIQAISNYWPIIYLEICIEWTKNFSYTPLKIINFLKDLGYSKFYLVSNKIQIMSEVSQEYCEQNLPVTANLLCTIKNHQLEIDHLIE